MSFKFNFGGESDISTDNDDVGQKGLVTSKAVKLRQCQQHRADFNMDLSHVELNTLMVGSHAMRYVDPDYAAEQIDNAGITSLIASSDLESGEYEGGLKIWECTYDLLEYMVDQSDEWFAKKNVLDLGCGAGLLGLFTFLRGARHVCLQDYNSEVIQSFTIPTVCGTLLSQQKDIAPVQTKTRGQDFEFLSGDWTDVSSYLTKKENHQKFDLILSAETIYNVEYYPKLCDVLHENMADNGVALFAAKAHYFGVGGGTYDFVKYLSESGMFEVEAVLKIDEGLSREILKVVKK